MFNKITLGPITVYMYGLMIAIGFASALFLCNYRGKKRGLSEDTIFGIFLCDFYVVYAFYYHSDFFSCLFNCITFSYKSASSSISTVFAHACYN